MKTLTSYVGRGGLNKAFWALHSLPVSGQRRGAALVFGREPSVNSLPAKLSPVGTLGTVFCWALGPSEQSLIIYLLICVY